MEKFSSLPRNSSTHGGRNIDVPSVEGDSVSTQPIPFSASASAEWIATSVPVRALQYMRRTSPTRVRSIREERASSTSSPRLDSMRK